MAPDVIDLVSSSPPRSGVDAPPPPAPSASVPAKRTASTLVSKAVNIEVLSDDFARSDDFDEILTSNNGRENQTQGTKRQRRLSVESRQHSRPSQVSRETQDISTLPPLKRATAAQAGFSVIDDPIEFTSSIEANQIGSQKASTAASNSRPAAPNRASSVTDPFASSPSAATTKPKPSAVVNNHHDLSSDPFASSSPVKTRVTKPCTPSQKAGQGRQQSRNPVAAWDPIPSSAPFSPTVPRTEILQRSASCAAVITIDESSESSSEDDDLPAIEDFDLSQPTKYSIPYANGTSSKQKAKSKSRNPTSKHTQEERSRQRVEKTAAKEAEKARRRREKELEKQERQKQRDIAAAIAEVNKARADKKVSTREMIVLLPTTLDPSLMVQLQTLLDGLDVQHNTQQSELNNLITWNRKINSRFDDDAGQWVPMPQRIEPEKHVLKVMTAEELVELATSEKLDQHIQAIKRHYPSEQIILLLQGITAWTRKNRNIRNRQFASGVRSQADSASTTARRRNDDPHQEYISEDVVEDALLRLQITHETLIHHTAVPLETAQWITTFTQHISTIPYKRQREEATSTARFCMESGQVKTGDDTQDTYVRMLQEIFRITAPIAYGVAAEYNSVTKLIEGLEKGGPNTLTGVHKSANRDGASSDRTIGQAVSRRLYKVFTGRDETSTDV